MQNGSVTERREPAVPATACSSTGAQAQPGHQSQDGPGGLGTLRRQIEPEWLDALPSSEPRAQASRRDLRRLNWWMGNARLVARALRRACPDDLPRRLVELGAGDGWFALQVARRLAPFWPGVQVQLVDQQAVVSEETREQFERLGWRMEFIQADVFEWLADAGAAPAEVIIMANLFLHHFEAPALARLFTEVRQRATVFLALEPRRSRRALFFSRLVGLIGCNAVTRHDAPASVRAGFIGRELSELWPEKSGWRFSEGPAGPFGHLFVARRCSGPGPGAGK